MPSPGHSKSADGIPSSDSSFAIQLIENATDVIYAHDLQGNFTYVNAAAERVFGLSRQEILRKKISDVIAPDRVPELHHRVRTLLSGQPLPNPLQVEIRAQDGTPLQFEISTELLRKNGTPVAIQAIARDVTDRRRSESALRESEGKFRALAETAASAIFIYAGSKFRYVNPMSEVLTGYSRKELLSMDFWDLVHPDFRELVRNRGLDRQSGAALPAQYEFKILTRSGAERWVDFSARVIPFEGGSAVLGTAFDITDRKRSSEDLLLQKALLEQLFECAPEGIVVQSNDGRVLRANLEFCRMFGYEPTEVPGCALDSLISSGDQRAEANALSRHVAAGGRFNVESVRRRKDGSDIDVSILGTPIQVEGGQVGVYVIYRDITERKSAEQALMESEAKFRAVADTAASAIFIHTGEAFLYANRASESISGYTREQLMQMGPYDLVHPTFRPLLRSRGTARIGGKTVPSRYEFMIVTSAGEERWLDFSASVIQFGGQTAILAIAFDITQRKRAEKMQSALYRIADCATSAPDLNELYQTIHGIVSELVYARNFYIALYDHEKNLLTWPYFVDEVELATPQGEAPGRGLTEYVLRTGQPLLANPETFDNLVASGEVESVGAPSIDWLGVPLKSGTKTFGVIVVQSYTEAFRYGPKEQEILTFVSQHVASAIEHRTDQEALRRSEARYRSLFERAAYGIFRSTLQGAVTDANPALATMLGYDAPADIVSLNLQRDIYVEGSDRERIINQYHQGRGDTFETRWRRKDGKIITVKLSGRTAMDRKGELDGYEVIVEDVTERRALEEQLRHAQKMEAVGRLAGGVAHDFNNLLTVIKGYSELILCQLVEADPIRSQLDEIRKAADRAATLTRQLLAFSRRQVLAPKVLDLNSVVVNMEKLLRRLLGEDVRLSCSLAHEVGHVKADPGQIEQVIMNLAVNARDAMPNGGSVVIETANLDVSEDWIREHAIVKAGPYVVLTVADDGMGMTEDVRSRVFEPFFTTKERGTGLGLSTVYGIVKQSGGYIWVESAAGEGSTFKVYLPRVDEAPDAPEMRIDDASLYRGSETILLVEDEDGVRTLIRQMLQRHGYKVIETRNAGEAILECERQDRDIQLLLTDVVLAQMSGSELAARLCSLKPDLRVLYISGYTEDAIVRHGVLKPGIAFLQKPFTAEALAIKVRTVLDGLDGEG